MLKTIKKQIFRKNKRGVMGIIFFFLLLFTILIVGFISINLVGLIDYASETVTPVMEELGMVGDVNLSHASEVTFGTVDTFVQALPWLLIFSYVALLIFSAVFILSWNYNPNPIFLGLYVMFVILLILGAIVISNIYQDLYTSSDLIGEKLREQSAMSYLIMYSPFIYAVIAFIIGIYIFAGKQSELQGGFDV